MSTCRKKYGADKITAHHEPTFGDLSNVLLTRLRVGYGKDEQIFEQSARTSQATVRSNQLKYNTSPYLEEVLSCFKVESLY